MDTRYKLFSILWNKTENMNDVSDDILVEKIVRCDETTMTNIYVIIKLYQIHTQDCFFIDPYGAIYSKEQYNYTVKFNTSNLPSRLKNMIYVYIDENDLPDLD